MRESRRAFERRVRAEAADLRYVHRLKALSDISDDELRSFFNRVRRIAPDIRTIIYSNGFEWRDWVNPGVGAVGIGIALATLGGPLSLIGAGLCGFGFLESGAKAAEKKIRLISDGELLDAIDAFYRDIEAEFVLRGVR